MLHKYTWSIHNANLFLDEDFGNKTTAGQNVYCFFLFVFNNWSCLGYKKKSRS